MKSLINYLNKLLSGVRIFVYKMGYSSILLWYLSVLEMFNPWWFNDVYNYTCKKSWTFRWIDHYYASFDSRNSAQLYTYMCMYVCALITCVNSLIIGTLSVALRMINLLCNLTAQYQLLNWSSLSLFFLIDFSAFESFPFAIWKRKRFVEHDK